MGNDQAMKGVVTLCGSVRFKDSFDKINKELTLGGFVVLQPGVWEHEWLHKNENNAELTKKGLDGLHCEKILMSHAIIVINVNGYIGLSTKREIEYAKKNDKLVYDLADYWKLLHWPEMSSWSISK